MINYSDTKIGDKLRITGIGAPGFAKLGDIVTVESVGPNRCDVVHDGTGERVYFALTCGAARLEAVSTSESDIQPVVEELRRRMKVSRDYDVASKPALFEIGVMAMTAQSDPHASAATYRQALIDICNLALKAQDRLIEKVTE